MSRAVSLPDDLLDKAAAFAALRQVSLEDFLSTTLAEQFDGLEYLRQRADRADASRFKAALSLIPDVDPEDYDRI
jgi:hypothetical protein